jgi:hypothetical protein
MSMASMTARDLRIACLAVAVLLAACSSGRATSDAGTSGNGGATGSAGSTGVGGGAGTGGDGGTGGGGGADSGDAGTTACGDAGACAADQVCLLSVFGAVSYVCPDAGHPTFPPNCDGLIVDMGGCCYGVEDWTYKCVARPSGCGTAVSCACAASTLCTTAPAGCEQKGANEIACWTSSP